MSVVKDKIVLCQIGLADFSVESVNEVPFYKRYSEFCRLFASKIPTVDFESFFAQPQENSAKKTIEWYFKPNSESPVRLSDLKEMDPELYHRLERKRNDIINNIRNSYNQASENDQKYLKAVLASFDTDYIDSITYNNNGQILFGIWGMRIKTGRQIDSVITEGVLDHRAYTISYQIQGDGKIVPFSTINRRSGHVLYGDKDIPRVIPGDGSIFKEWVPEAPHGKTVKSDMIYTAVCERQTDAQEHAGEISDAGSVNRKTYQIRFNLGEFGHTSDPTEYEKEAGSYLLSNEIPSVEPLNGYRFVGWDKNPFDFEVNGDTVFVAQYELAVVDDESFTVYFRGGDHGSLKGLTKYRKHKGERVVDSEVPTVVPSKGYKFIGWNNTPDGFVVNGDAEFVAQYEEKASWWSGFWHRFTGKGCLKWLLWLLLALLLLTLLFFGIRSCNSCSRGDHLPFSEIGIPRVPGWTDPNPFNPGNGNDSGNGDGVDHDNGNNPGNGNDPVIGNPIPNPPINPDDPGAGLLPEHPNTPVPVPDDDIIDDEDGRRKIVADRLNILLDDDNLSITEFAQDFKAVYPGDQYKIIYADNIIKRLQIIVPSAEREKVKRELIGRLPEKYTSENVFIWDEALFERHYKPNDGRLEECWYLDAIRAYQAWDVTMGNDSLIVAIVDDGFSLIHEELQDKVVKPYNVYKHDNEVSELPDRHGSHVAGLAVGKADNRKGIAGIAPNCKLMPVKIADEYGNMTTTGVVDGVLYAVYNGASVVNLSLGMYINSRIPETEQKNLIRNHFKEEERLWKKVFEIANKKNSVIVIAAGNENLLAGIDPMHRGDNVIVVAAVDKYHRPAWGKSNFSNYGEHTDVSAPGVDILSSVGNNHYASMSGTSMAAPIVSGAVALVKSVNPTLNTAQIRAVLQETGLPVTGNVGRLIQLDKALEKAKNFSQDSIPTPHTGDVQIQLKWHNLNDLDIACTDPNGQMVSYNNKRIPSGGCLDVDMNAGGRNSRQPLENIYWPTGGAPAGNYTVYLKYYSRKDTAEDASAYEIFVKYGDQTENYSGSLSSSNKGWIKICSFSL